MFVMFTQEILCNYFTSMSSSLQYLALVLKYIAAVFLCCQACLQCCCQYIAVVLLCCQARLQCCCQYIAAVLLCCQARLQWRTSGIQCVLNAVVHLVDT